MAWGSLQDHKVTWACSASTMLLLHLLSPPAYLYPTVACPQNENTSCIYTLNIQSEARMGISHSTRKQHGCMLHGMDLLAFLRQVCDLHGWLLSCLPPLLALPLAAQHNHLSPPSWPWTQDTAQLPLACGVMQKRKVEHAVLQIAGEPFSSPCSWWAVLMSMHSSLPLGSPATSQHRLAKHSPSPRMLEKKKIPRSDILTVHAVLKESLLIFTNFCNDLWDPWTDLGKPYEAAFLAEIYWAQSRFKSQLKGVCRVGQNWATRGTDLRKVLQSSAEGNSWISHALSGYHCGPQRVTGVVKPANPIPLTQHDFSAPYKDAAS